MKFDSQTGSFAYVDVETSGGSCGEDRIIEIAIVTVDEGIINQWSTLIDPGCDIPRSIQSLTGITPAMLVAAPTFRSVAVEVAERLHGRLFVAHNARFDYGFVRQELARCGIHYSTRPLCTVRLSRALFPAYRGFSLDALIKRFELTVTDRHRALPDAVALVDLMQIYAKLFDAETLDTTIRSLIKQASLPPHLSTVVLDDIPQGPGVYRFYGHNDLPLYIGKSVNLRKRILSHFVVTAKQRSSTRVGMETQRIEYDTAAGDLSASVLELQQIHALHPLYNRKGRKAASGFLVRLSHTLPVVEIVAADEVQSLRTHQWYGPFFSAARAKNLLIRLAKAQRLCLILMGLEKRRPPCFGHQLGACDGACIDPAKGERMFLRLATALVAYRIPAWPYRGILIVQEHDAESGREEAHIFYDWCHIGRALDDSDIATLTTTEPRCQFRADMYYLLKQQMRLKNTKAGKMRILPLVATSTQHDGHLSACAINDLIW